MTTQAEHTTGTSHPGLAAWVERSRRAHHPRRDPLGRRVRRGVGPADDPPGRWRHLHPAQPRQEAEQLLRGLRPQRRRPGRGPHLHLLRGREGRRLHQQLEVAGRDEGPDDATSTAGCMRGRTMYVIPFVMGHIEADVPMFGVEITDSAYVVVSWRSWPASAPRCSRPSRSRTPTSSRACTRSASRSTDGQADVAVAVQRDQVHRPLPRGPARSGATARATAATPCSARSATRCASPRRWPATRAGWPSTCSSSSSPPRTGSVHYIAGAFPSACGKTNLAMIEPHSTAGRPRWSVTTSPGCASAPTAACTPSTPSSACSASRPAPACTPTPTRCARWRRATRSSPTSPSPTTATSGGRT